MGGGGWEGRWKGRGLGRREEGRNGESSVDRDGGKGGRMNMGSGKNIFQLRESF